MKHHVGVLPLGEIPELVMKIITANISAQFMLPAMIVSSIALPEPAFDKRRLQYNAGMVINRCEQMHFDNCTKIIAIMKQDLFIPIFKHVYGEARQGGKTALISLFRLEKNPDGSLPRQDQFYERTAKVALHELGHLFDLFHCEQPKCIMHFSGSIQELDQTALYLCRQCQSFLSEQTR